MKYVVINLNTGRLVRRDGFISFNYETALAINFQLTDAAIPSRITGDNLDDIRQIQSDYNLPLI